MSDTVDGEVVSPPARRPRPWWRLVLGIGLLAAAGGLLMLRWFPDLQARMFGTRTGVPRYAIDPPADFRRSESLSAAPGSLAGSNVLLVTLDTTRADRIGCYGNDRVRTPRLDRLARSGVLFSDVTAVAPATLPSHASILTGLYPYHHGARANSVFQLGPEHETLPEILREAGYATAAFVSAFVLDGRFGVAQGFETFEDQMGTAQSELWLEVAERTGDQTTDVSIEWLKLHGGKKFFAWVHYYDPHHPYRAPAEYANEKTQLGYDAEITFMDAQVGRLLDALDELGITEKTLVVVMGDHGEGLGHHDEGSHGILVYESVLRVPFIMRCGDKLGTGVHIDTPVSQVDVTPTVLSLLGLPTPPGLDGRDLTQAPVERRTLYFETLQGLIEHECAALLGVREGDVKYIYGLQPELYDLKADPFEENDLAAARRGEAERLHEKLRKFYGDDLDKASTPEPTETLSPEERAKLAALGYVTASETSLVEPSQRTDPKKTMELLTRATAAVALGIPDALPELEKLAVEFPESHTVHLYRGQAYTQMGELDRAEAAYERALEIRPNHPQVLLSLAQVKAKQNDITEALSLYEMLLGRLPDSAGVKSEYARILARAGEFGKATDLLKASLDLDPTEAETPSTLLRVATQAGRREEALTALRAALDRNPHLALVRSTLAGAIADAGQFDEAQAMLETGIRLDPNVSELINNLAFLYVTHPNAELRRPYEAIQMMEELCQRTKYEDARLLNTLAVVYFSRHRVDEAIATAQKALAIAKTAADPKHRALVPAIEAALQGYRKAKADGLAPLLRPEQTDRPTTSATSQPAK